eukprot:SAG31_NODE_7_length_42755_cov_130.245728_43_plen_185_part_00
MFECCASTQGRHAKPQPRQRHDPAKNEGTTDPRAALNELLLKTGVTGIDSAAPDERHAAVESLRVELQSERISHLRRRAQAAGVSQADLDGADDSDTPRAALIELLLAQLPKIDAVGIGAVSTPHFGVAKQPGASEAAAQPIEARASSKGSRWTMVRKSTAPSSNAPDGLSFVVAENMSVPKRQ